MLRKILLFCGIISSLLYVTINIVVPTQFPGYSSVSQTVSELSAIDAPTRPLWVLLCIFYSLLIIAFGWGALRSAGRNRPLRVIAVLLIAYGISGLFWPPMHQRGNKMSLTDTMHIVFAIATVILMLLAIGFGAVAFGKRFRYYSIATIIMLCVFGGLTGMDGPRIAANLPTPMVGVWERISIGFFLLWIIVFAIILLKAETSASSLTAAATHDTLRGKVSGDQQRSKMKQAM
jgi:hypothetical protein